MKFDNKKSLSITFVLPGTGTFPGGGPKVVFEYANALVRRGHQVTVVHPLFLNTEFTAMQFGKGITRYVQRSIDKSYRPDAWFRIDPRVRLLWKPTLHPRHIPDADVIVATWWQTAEWVARYPQSKGEKFYLLQHLETWGGPEVRVMATWRMSLRKIVIARWLYELAERLREEAIYIPNGLDFNAFGMDVDPRERNPHCAMMLYHNAAWKGSADGLVALRIVRERIPKLNVDLFGVSAPQNGLPSWIRYHRNPPQLLLRQLYNRAAIFLAPSWTEGWGLPGSEAMQCGCALAATDIGGHREYAIHGETALLSPPKEPALMASNLVSLLQNPEQRIHLARSGNRYIQQFTWERAVNAFEAALLADVASRSNY